MSKIPQEQVPGVSHRRVGDIVITAISDGFVDGGLDVLRNIDQEEARRILAESFRPARPAPAITSGPPPARCSRTSPPPVLIPRRSRRCCLPTCTRTMNRANWIRPDRPAASPLGPSKRSHRKLLHPRRQWAGARLLLLGFDRCVEDKMRP
jgi:hypothetical protein